MTLATTHSIHSIKKQQGIVLVVALLILVVMTILGVSMLSSSTLEERMASNIQAKNITFQAAESCVRQSLLLVNEPLRVAAAQNQDLSNVNAPLDCVFNNVNAQVNYTLPTNVNQRKGNINGFGIDEGIAGYIIFMTGTSSLASGTNSSVTLAGQLVAPD